jgi:hypothetical protein
MVLFHEGELRSLIRLSSEDHSAIARRVTNLLREPNPVKTGRVFLEEGLVHRTARGELVRSKSEVIIANILSAMNLWYQYEEPFVGRDGSVRYPDFTCKKQKTDKRALLIEHLGMMQDASYQRRWETKLKWYRLHDVRLAEESRDDLVTLLVTSETKGIDSAQIKARIQEILHL